MNENAQDPMWPHFAPLWTEFQQVVAGDLIVAGGYGLFLKQNWLLENLEVATVIPFSRWRDTTPRATKDLDFVLGLDLIADAATQRGLLNALLKHDFNVSVKHPRWQFEKRVSDTNTLIVELHAPLPPGNQTGLQVDRIQVKRKPSLGESGIHGRTNAEAVGCALHPFSLEAHGIVIQVPNAVTWAIMKLTAMKDRQVKSVDAGLSEKRRAFELAQAMKHGQDVCRVVAMVTREERDRTTIVVDAIRKTPEFTIAAGILSSIFSGSASWASQRLAPQWNPDDFELIWNTLAEWFR